MFIQRTLGSTLENFSKKFPVVMIAGPRQVGKSTLLKETYPKSDYITLDDPNLRELAQQDPELLLSRYRAPLIIDEVQYAPELFPLLKKRVDEDRKPGQYFLSGSQQFRLMRNVSETLAGRIGILQLGTLTNRELLKDVTAAPLPESLSDLKRDQAPTDKIFELIWRGGYPALYGDSALAPGEFFPSYVQTYIQRDVRDLACQSALNLDPLSASKIDPSFRHAYAG